MKRSNYLGGTLIFAVTAVVLLMSGCKKDDEGSGPENPDQQPKSYFTVEYMGDTYHTDAPTIVTAEASGELYITCSADFTDNSPTLGAELEMLSVPATGSHAFDGTWGFVAAQGSEAWFCTPTTTLTIDQHDSEKKFVKGKVSGPMTTFTGASTNDISLAFAFYYD